MALSRANLDILGQVQQIIDAYDFALSLRQIYYQLVAKQIIPNEQKHYKNLSRLCVIGRDTGILQETAFIDRLRVVDKPASWDDLSDFLEDVRGAYKKNKWNNQNSYIEIWTEKDALRGVVAPITHDYDVALFVVRGQVSRTAIYESYKRFAQKVMEGKECTLFYFGDFDPSGISIYTSIIERLKEFGEGLPIEFKRVALTAEQIREHDLPQDPAKTSDPNCNKFIKEYGDNVVELDSLPPNVLRELIRESIESKMDGQLFGQVQQVEEGERIKLDELIQEIQDRAP